MIAAIAVAVVAGTIALLMPRSSLRLGVLLPLTGPHAAQGLGMRNAIRLAVDEVNARGGVQGKKVQLVELDDASSADAARAGARKLIDDKHVLGVLDHYDIQCSVATQPMFFDAGLGNIVAGVATRFTVETLSTDYRIIAGAPPRMQVMAKYAWETLGARSFMYLRDDTDFAKEMLNAFRAGVSPYLNLVAAGYDLVSPDDAKMAQLIEKIRETKPAYLFYAGEDELGGKFLGKLRSAGIDTPFQSGTHFPSQQFIDAAQGKAEGALAVFHGPPTEDFPKGREFLAAYAAKKYPEPPGAYGIYGYAAAQAMLGAMEKSFLTRPSVVGALGHEGFETALGPIRFFYLGSTYNPSVVYKVVSGKWVPVLVSKDSRAPLEPYKPQ